MGVPKGFRVVLANLFMLELEPVKFSESYFLAPATDLLYLSLPFLCRQRLRLYSLASEVN